MQRIAVAGLGIIGSAWAQNLHADGLTVRGWNRTSKDFPFYEADLAKAVADAEMIIIVVADPPAVESVLDGIVPHLKPGQIVAQSSTISAEWARLFAKRVVATGAEFLEAPFTGKQTGGGSAQNGLLSRRNGGTRRKSAASTGTAQRPHFAHRPDRHGLFAKARDESQSGPYGAGLERKPEPGPRGRNSR